MSQVNDFQSVPVPSQHVAAVYRFLSDLDKGEFPPDSSQAGTEDEPDVWTDANLERLANSDKKAVLILAKILTALSSSPDEWFSLKQLEGQTGETQHQMRYIWSSLTRHFQSKYNTKTWPVKTKWGTQFTPHREPVMFYKVTPDRASQWKRVTGR